MNWLARNSASIQSLAAIVTALIALSALIGIKVQLDEAERLQGLQSAREAYRSHLALSIANPELAEPENVCSLLTSSKAKAYTAFVDHLLYSAEQMLDAEADWEATFRDELLPHAAYLCPAGETIAGTKSVKTLLAGFKAGEICAKAIKCN